MPTCPKFYSQNSGPFRLTNCKPSELSFPPPNNKLDIRLLSSVADSSVLLINSLTLSPANSLYSSNFRFILSYSSLSFLTPPPPHFLVLSWVFPSHCHRRFAGAKRKMKLIRGALGSLSVGLSRQFQCPQMIRALSAGANDIPNSNSFESTDDFEQRIFGDVTGNSSNSKSFYQKLDRIEKAHDRMGFGTNFNVGNRFEFMDGLDESFNTLSDGMDGKLKEAASYFEVDENEIWEDENYTYRPDVNFDRIGETYDTKDLDLRQPGVWKPAKKHEFEVTTEKVLRKADFRNVRFLANFITDAGIIIKRSKTKISAKAQRKVAREIKTARAFGLMPFTTMGTKHFAFGKTMESLDEDYEYETYDDYNFVDEEASQNPH